ncbi:MAG: anhydro-N-acetylmuramic acid kinase [Candidatus Riflebacteria bacterium]|nr:anhydro-N-acetylmuramic acid kinase [Candidatus Riflebacteria bacterium]
MIILGLMSGTSGDGIDGVAAEFFNNDSFKFLWHKSYKFSDKQFTRIQRLIKSANAESVTLGNAYISRLYAEACSYFFTNEQALPDYLAAHGQTVFHHPNVAIWDEFKVSGTLQLLDGFLLSHLTKLPVIYNFRQADMAVGGQGAPLVPYADLKMFGGNLENKKYRIILNLGGIANVTILQGSANGSAVKCAFDTGPGNGLMDDYIQLNNLGRFDELGKIASQGKTIDDVLKLLLADPYFEQQPPKSTGREYFSVGRVIDKLQGLSFADSMSTLMDFTVESILNAIKPSIFNTDELIVAGGGAFNLELLGRLRKKCLLSNIAVKTSAEHGIPVMAREGMAFSILGNAFLNKEPGNVLSATGADKLVVLGSLATVY